MQLNGPLASPLQRPAWKRPRTERYVLNELIIGKRSGALEGAGQPVAQICQKLEIGVATLPRRRSQFRGMSDAEIRRLKELEEQNRRLKKAVTDLTLDKQILKELNEGTW